MDPAIVNALPSLGTFDFLVVGAGPSAAGLLKALLGSSAAAAETKVDDPMNPFTVAVLEQGGAGPPRRAMDQWFTAKPFAVELRSYLLGNSSFRHYPVQEKMLKHAIPNMP
jgi:hypothetical protein